MEIIGKQYKSLPCSLLVPCQHRILNDALYLTSTLCWSLLLTRAMKTRASNATKQPGLVDLSPPVVRTCDHGASSKKDVAANKRAAKEEKRKNAVGVVAQMERDMAEANAQDETPRAAPSKLRCTETYIKVPLTPDGSDVEMTSDVPSDFVDGHQTGRATTEELVSGQDESSEEEAPPKKKPKRVKGGGFRESVKEFNDNERTEKRRVVEARDVDIEISDDEPMVSAEYLVLIALLTADL